MIILPIKINSRGSCLSSELNSFLSDNYGRQKHSEMKNELLSLCNELNDLDLTLHSVRLQVVQWFKRIENRLKLKTEVTEQHKARAAQVRARGHWVEKGEKNTKYFLNLEKLRTNVKIIDSLINEVGQLVTDQNDIMKMQRDYYAKSYRKNISDVNTMDKINSFFGNTLWETPVPRTEERVRGRFERNALCT